jgi:hypothetical protein
MVHASAFSCYPVTSSWSRCRAPRSTTPLLPLSHESRLRMPSLGTQAQTIYLRFVSARWFPASCKASSFSPHVGSPFCVPLVLVGWSWACSHCCVLGWVRHAIDVADSSLPMPNGMSKQRSGLFPLRRRQQALVRSSTAKLTTLRKQALTAKRWISMLQLYWLKHQQTRLYRSRQVHPAASRRSDRQQLKLRYERCTSSHPNVHRFDQQRRRTEHNGPRQQCHCAAPR